MKRVKGIIGTATNNSHLTSLIAHQNRVASHSYKDLQESHQIRAKRLFSSRTAYFATKLVPRKSKSQVFGQRKTTCKFEFGGGDHILDIAERREDFDLLRRIKGFDLFACEAQYHRSCAKSYTRDPSVWQSTSDRAVSRQAAMEAAHAKAFSHVCGIVDVDVLQKMAVTKLDQLRDIYVEKLRDGMKFNEME